MLLKLIFIAFYLISLNTSHARLSEDLSDFDDLSGISYKLKLENELLDILIKLLQKIKKTIH